MGLLDDAIREHLDLKRRNGADPGEVERLEREALGPVRREQRPLATTPDEIEAVPAHDVDQPYEFDEPPVTPSRADHVEEPVGSTGPVEFDEWEQPELEQPEPEPEPERPAKRRGFLGRLRGDHANEVEFESDEDRQGRVEFEPADDEPDPFDEPPILQRSQPAAAQAAEPMAAEPQTTEPPSAAEPRVDEVDPFATQAYELPPPAAGERSLPKRPDFGELPSATPAPAPERAEPEPEPEPELERFPRDDEQDPSASAEPAPFASEPETAVPAPPQGDELADDFDALSGRTMEHDVTQHFTEGDDDLLEETPDFLQDAPDHDRLWFEQRPPKDFDFDS